MIALYYNHDETTVGLCFVYFDYFSNRLVELVDPVLLHVYAYNEVILLHYATVASPNG